jgi:hypothetical protein
LHLLDAQDRLRVPDTHLNRTKYPQDEGLYNDEGRGSDSQGEVDANVPADIRVRASVAVDLGPILKPNAATCKRSATNIGEVIQEKALKARAWSGLPI